MIFSADKICKKFLQVILLVVYLSSYMSVSSSMAGAPHALRHVGIDYANFVIPSPDGVKGLDVELIKLFAKHLGLDYEWVPASWSTVFTSLPKKGDLIANGLTILPAREQLLAFSTPTFPTGVWLVAKADSHMQPILPSGDIIQDIERVKKALKGHTVLSMKNTCLDSTLYGLDTYGAEIRTFEDSENLDDMAIALLDGAAEATLLDIPDALIALEKWPSEIKIIGPVSEFQKMGVAFSKEAPELLEKFNAFFEELWRSGEYRTMVEKYYPTVFLYFEDFFHY